MLQLPVAELEEWVVARTRHYDPGFVSHDPDFGHAHITALAPFDPAPTQATLDVVGAIAAWTTPMAVRLAEIDQFPNGIIHLRPEPDTALRRLTRELAAAFPQFPAYEGRFGPFVDPHLTLDAVSDEVSVESTRQLVGSRIPVTTRLDVLQLAWWESARCHVLHQWPLGGFASSLPFATLIS